MGFFEKLGFGLKKTRKASFESIAELMDSPKITEELYEELTERLILADTGADVAEELVDELRELVKRMRRRLNHKCLCCSIFCPDWDKENDCCVFTTLERELGIEVDK